MTTTVATRNSLLGRTRAEGIVVRHQVQVGASRFGFCFTAPQAMDRRGAGEALADAVAELRALDTTFGPLRERSLVSRFRRGEIAADLYAPLADLVERCVLMRAATDGWFDAWAVPGGFDPSGLVKGWSVERAAARLRAAGIANYAIHAGADVTVRGHSPANRPWKIAVRDPYDGRRVIETLELTSGAVATTGAAGRRDHIVDPHTGRQSEGFALTTVVGPELSAANGYAIALYAAGPTALSWFPTADGYRALDRTGRL